MKKTGSKATYWLMAATVLVIFLPLVPVYVDYSTFIHPWRAEFAASVLLIVLLTAAYGNTEFRSFLAEMPRNEIRLLVVPCIAFIVWSCLSALWARSAAFAFYHAAVWFCY